MQDYQLESTIREIMNQMSKPINMRVESSSLEISQLKSSTLQNVKYIDGLGEKIDETDHKIYQQNLVIEGIVNKINQLELKSSNQQNKFNSEQVNIRNDINTLMTHTSEHKGLLTQLNDKMIHFKQQAEIGLDVVKQSIMQWQQIVSQNQITIANFEKIQIEFMDDINQRSSSMDALSHNLLLELSKQQDQVGAIDHNYTRLNEKIEQIKIELNNAKQSYNVQNPEINRRSQSVDLYTVTSHCDCQKLQIQLKSELSKQIEQMSSRLYECEEQGWVDLIRQEMSNKFTLLNDNQNQQLQTLLNIQQTQIDEQQRMNELLDNQLQFKSNMNDIQEQLNQQAYLLNQQAIQLVQTMNKCTSPIQQFTTIDQTIKQQALLMDNLQLDTVEESYSQTPKQTLILQQSTQLNVEQIESIIINSNTVNQYIIQQVEAFQVQTTQQLNVINQKQDIINIRLTNDLIKLRSDHTNNMILRQLQIFEKHITKSNVQCQKQQETNNIITCMMLQHELVGIQSESLKLHNAETQLDYEYDPNQMDYSTYMFYQGHKQSNVELLLKVLQCNASIKTNRLLTQQPAKQQYRPLETLKHDHSPIKEQPSKQNYRRKLSIINPKHELSLDLKSVTMHQSVRHHSQRDSDSIPRTIQDKIDQLNSSMDQDYRQLPQSLRKNVLVRYKKQY